jgi:pectin lyase
MRGSLLALLGAASSVSAVAISERATYAVVGTPEGFGKGTTGGGSAACQVPNGIAQLKSWLADTTARCIVLDKE